MKRINLKKFVAFRDDGDIRCIGSMQECDAERDDYYAEQYGLDCEDAERYEYIDKVAGESGDAITVFSVQELIETARDGWEPARDALHNIASNLKREVMLEDNKETK